jgi:cell division protein FtsB
MTRKRHTLRQIIRKLKGADQLNGKGRRLAGIFQHLEISEQTYHRWKMQYSGIEGGQAKKLKKLQEESDKVERMVADLSLGPGILQEAMKGK